MSSEGATPAEAPDALVARGYDRVADRDEALEPAGRAWPRLRRLDRLLADVPAGARVLDAGCGNGDADTTPALIGDAGFDVVEADVETQFEGDHDVDYLWVLATRR